MLKEFNEFYKLNLNEEVNEDEEYKKFEEKMASDHRIHEFRLNSSSDNYLIRYIYNIFYNTYKAETGSSWDINLFRHRISDWTFYGSYNGFISVRFQRSGPIKLTGAAGVSKDIYQGFDLCSKMNSDTPIWGAVSEKIAVLLTKIGYIRIPGKIISMILPYMKHVFGGEVETDDTGNIIMHTTDEHGLPIKAVKHFVCNYSYIDWMLEDRPDNILKKLPTAVSFLFRKLIKTFIKKPIKESDEDIDFIDEDIWFINEERKYFGNKGAGILLYCKENNKFLMAIRSLFVNQSGTLGIWGGRIEDEDKNKLPNEQIKNAALRELKEETGYDEPINLYFLSIFSDKRFKFYNYLGIIDNPFVPKLNWETSKTYWMTLEELTENERFVMVGETKIYKHFGLKELLTDLNLEKIKSHIDTAPNQQE